MKKLLIFILILFVLAAGGLFAVYMTLDEESYKVQIIEATKELTGRDMTVNGAVSINLFPTPTITMSDVVVKNKPGLDAPNLLTIKQVDASVKWGSLFENPLIIEKVTLHEPEIFVGRDKNGIPNWDFPFLMERAKEGQSDDLIGQSILDLPPQFKNLVIEKGTLHYASAVSGFTLTLPQVNGRLESQSISGPFNFKGTFNWNNSPVQAVLTSGKISGNLATDIKLTLTDSSKAVLGLTGKIENLVRSADMTGGFSFNIPQLSRFLTNAVGYKDLPPSLEKPIVGTSTFVFSKDKAEFKDIALRYGTEELENSSTGTVTFTYPNLQNKLTRVYVSLLLSKLDVDAFRPLIPSSEEIQTRILGWSRSFKHELDLTLKAKDLSFGGDVLKESSLQLLFQNGGLEVKEFKTTLPGGTNIVASGLVATQDNKPVAKITFGVSAPDPKKAVEWFKLPTDSFVTLTGLDNVKLQGSMVLRPTDIAFNNIEASLNDGSIKGAVAFSLTEQKPTGVAELTLKNINLDTYIPYTAPTENRTFVALLTEMRDALLNSDILSKFDFKLKLTGSDVTFRNIPIRSLMYDGFVRSGEWVTSKMTLSQAATADVDLSARIQQLPNRSIYVQNLTYDISIPKASVFLDRAKITPPIQGALNRVSLKGTVSGTLDSLKVNLENTFSQAQVNVNGTIENLTKEPTYALALDLAHPNFQQFVKLFNPNFNHLRSLTGAFTFKSNLKGTAEAFSLMQTETMIGNQRLKGDMTVSYPDNRPTLKGNVSTSLLYLEKFIPQKSLFRGVNPQNRKAQFSNDLLDLKDLDNLDLDISLTTDKLLFGNVDMDLVSAHYTLKENVLAIDSFKGTLNGGAFNMTAHLNASTAVPMLRASLQAEDMALRPDVLRLGLFRLKSGSASFSADLTTRGNSIEDMVKALSATGRYSIKNGILSSLNLNTFERSVQVVVAKGTDTDGLANRLKKEITTGETAFESLTGSYAVTNGVARTSDTLLRAGDANAIIQLSFDMPNWTILSSMGLTMQPFAGFPPVSIVVKGLANAPETEIDLEPFIKYISTAAADAQNEALQQAREAERQQAELDEKQRQERVKAIAAETVAVVEKAERIIQLAPSPEAEHEMIRAKDALAVLQELSLKENISVADLQKIEEQGALAVSRATEAQKEAAEKATTAMRQQMAGLETTAQSRMHAINRIHQRLQGVDMIEQAYKKGFSTMTLIQQLKAYVDEGGDLAQMQQAMAQAVDAAEIMELTYESVAKFDMEGTTPVSSGTTSGSIVRGTITRRGM